MYSAKKNHNRWKNLEEEFFANVFPVKPSAQDRERHEGVCPDTLLVSLLGLYKNFTR